MHQANPIAATAPRLFKTRWKQKQARLEQHLLDLAEAIASTE